MSNFLRLSLLTFISVTFGYNASAQVPDSVAITTNGSWIIEHSEAVYGFNPQTGAYEWMVNYDYDYYRSGGDTLINGEIFTKLMGIALQKNADGSYSLNNQNAVESYIFAYRNDLDKRAFKMPNGMTTEEDWYDFNYAVGDTIWNPNTIIQTPYIVLTSIDSIDYCATNYLRHNFAGEPGSSVQRVGSTNNFFHNYSDLFLNDRIVYFCEQSTPLSAIAGIEETEIEESILLYPNPARNSVHFSTKNNVIPSKIIIQNLAGEIVLQDHSGATSFSIDHLSSGVYLVTIELSGLLKTVRLVKE